MTSPKNPGVMCPGVYRREPHPGGRGPCVHCKKETGAWCPACRVFSCTGNGCLTAHTATCKTWEKNP